MGNKNSFSAAPRNVENDDVGTWGLPEGAIARLGRGRADDMAFSPNEQYFAVGTAIGLWLYELSTLSPIALWETDRGCSDITFSPDSRWLALHRYHEAIRVWNIQDKVCIAEMELTKVQDRWGLSKPVFSKDGERLVVFNGKEYNRKVQSWSPQTGALLSETQISSTVYRVDPTCFSPDLSLLAGMCYIRDSRTAEFIAVWHVETGEQAARLDWSEDRWGRLCFSLCGRFLAAGGSEGRIQVWDVETGNLEGTYTRHEEAHMHPYYTPEDGLIAAVASPAQSKIEIWNLEKGKKIDTFEQQSEVNFVRFSENGTRLAYIDSNEIKIWTKGRQVDQAFRTIQGPTQTVSSLAFTPDEKTLAATYWSGNAFLWDVSNQCVRYPSEELCNGIHKVYPTLTGKILATDRGEDTVKVWDFGNSELLAEIAIPESGLSRRTGADALALTGQRLARVGRDHNIYVWEYKSTSNDTDKRENWGKCAVLVGHTEDILALALSPDGKRLASIAAGRLETSKVPVRDVRLWDVDAGEQIAQLAPKHADSKLYIGAGNSIAGIAFSPLGEIIAGGHGGEIMLWDATDGKLLMRIPQPRGNRRPIALRFSPCGQYLASGSWWQPRLQKVPIRLWEIATGKNIATFWGHTTDVQCFAFSQDSTLLVSGGHDGAIYLWDLTLYL